MTQIIAIIILISTAISIIKPNKQIESFNHAHR